MKFNCTQLSLSKQLALADRAIPSRPTHPVLANFLVVADDKAQQVEISAFDLSLGIKVSFPAVIEDGGMFAFPAKLFKDIVSRLPDEELTIAVKDLQCTIVSSTGKYQLTVMTAEDYPELPEVEEDTVELPIGSLSNALRGSLFAVSTEESKQVLNGSHMSFNGELIEIASTDGHRLSVVSFLVDTFSTLLLGQDGITIPGKALRELTLMMTGAKAETAMFSCDRHQASFTWEGAKLTTRLLEGQYPNYNQLIPKQFSRQMTIDRKLLLNTLERVAIVAEQKNNVAKFSITQDELTISAEAQDVGSANEKLPIQYVGEDLDIAFNIKYLIDGLKIMETSEVSMRFNSPTSPAIVTPLGEQKMTYLCMPVQIRDAS